ncbi:helix-turn-helix domain-containing protein [Streptomyces sp. AK02-01A]|uniref:AraC-like ligand-binding domain-containing protein n=1 Tax=Streptomyces sp. AK02-01A TaxID=3028648 RepID=UPI0029B89E17|nr:helix-turn-helix domain-containing protein [Streptomyces sp. AK02-01A]MDX3851809.1 helix-turn-helix domain-containing protein [Streptomyces sp. AK02-01A]
MNAATAGREQAERLEHLGSQVFAPLSVVPDGDDRDFRGTLRHATAGDVVVTRVWATACDVMRLPTLIGSGDHELVKVTLRGRGQVGFEQDGRRCLLGPDELVAYETVRPYTLCFTEPADLVVLGIPRTLLGPHIDQVAGRTACAIPADSGAHRLAATLLRDAADDLDGLAGDNGPHLADALVSLALSALAGPSVVPPGQELADQVLTYCLRRLSDPRLSAESVAAEHRISLRYLYKILEPRGIRLSAWIRSRRMERIRHDLSDPALGHRAAAMIAADWGVLDATHLSRALRAECGQSAAEIRRTARLRGAGLRPPR